MTRMIATLMTLAFAAATADANDLATTGKVTYTRDVAPIFFKNCAECHRPGEVAPMSLLTYDTARPWAKSIKQKVAAREMPPWLASPAYGHFKNDARLSDAEIDIIVHWVDQGAAKGDPADMPQAPEFSSGWRLGEPDYVIDLPEVTVPATGNDYFPDLSAMVDIPEDRWVSAVEIRPSNKAVAHHVVIFSAGGQGGMNLSSDFGVLAVWAAGTAPTVFPEGMGRWVHKGERLMTNMHYHPNGQPAVDQTRIGLHFGEGELKQEVRAALNGAWSFSIPANDPNHELRTSWTMDQDVNVVSLFPHMHLRGKDMRFTAVYPDGREKILLDVPKWDFNWQLFYYPQEFIPLPKGTRIDVVAHYDNSANNPSNPDPNRNVGFGLQSTDEMMFGIFEFVTADGAPVAQLTDTERIDNLVASMPHDSTYKVDFAFGPDVFPTALNLPREGDGEWHIPLHGQMIALPISDIKWEGAAFSFFLKLQFGGMGGEFKAKGHVSEDGSLIGEFITGGAKFLPLNDFSGKRAGA